MFETIAQQSKGSRDPQWMSSHPDPGNRTAYITKEAQALTIARPADTSGFAPTKARFASLPAPMTMAEVERRGSQPGEGSPETVGTPGRPVPVPSAQARQVNGGIFVASVPSNWTSLASQTAIKVVPENGYGPLNGQTVFTHGVEFGVARAASQDLKEATTVWLRGIAQSNPDLRAAGNQQYVKLSQRTALGTPLTNPSPLGGTERITVYTAFLSNGNLFYFLTVAPEVDAPALRDTFSHIGQSIRFTDGR